jgi:hypothetical protein
LKGFTVADTAPIDLGKLSFKGITTEFAPSPAGLYDAIVESSEVRMGQQSNQPYLAVTFALRGDKPDGSGRATGKQWNNYPLQPNTLWRLKKDAIAMGVPVEKLESEFSIEELQEDILNRDVVLEVEIENYKPNPQGEPDVIKQRNKVRAVHPAGTAPQTAKTSKGKKGF